MELKKSTSADLENKRSYFFLAGLAIAQIIVLLAVNWKTYEKRIVEFGDLDIVIEEEIVQMTVRKVQKPPPPPPPEQISIVDDIVELEEELIMESVEVDQDDEVEVVDFSGEESDEVLNFAIVENKPVFPGCENEKTEKDREECFIRMLGIHVGNNFKYPELAKTMGIQGRVVVNFVIEKDGSISNVTIVKPVEESIDAEALRVIKLLPKFEPAKQRGRPVRMGFNMPINAKIN